MTFKNRTVLCFILARGGSKGLPRKNIRIIADKPLIAHSILQAKGISIIDDIFISTEDFEIKKIALEFGAKVIDRPIDLASDTSLYLDPIKHLIHKIPETKNNPIIILLQSTSPIRKIIDILHCIENLRENIDCVVSISLVKKHPSRMFKEKNGLLEYYDENPPKSNRQDSETLYEMNGSILVTTSNFLLNQEKIPMGGKMEGYLLDEISSLDIDTSFDFQVCKFFMENKPNDHNL